MSKIQAVLLQFVTLFKSAFLCILIIGRNYFLSKSLISDKSSTCGSTFSSAGSSSFLGIVAFTALTIKKTTKAIIKKLITAFKKLPTLNEALPTLITKAEKSMLPKNRPRKGLIM